MGSWAGAVSAAGEGTLLSRHFLREMETCDTPIKSAMAWQDGQPDPAGRAATSSLSPGGGHSMAGAPATSPPGPCSPAEGGESTISHGSLCPTQPGHLAAAAPAVPQSQHVPSARESGQRVLPDPSGHPQPAQGGGMWSPPSRACCLHCLAALTPGRQRLAGCAGLVPQPWQLLPALLSVLQTKPGCHGPWGPWGVLPISTPSICPQVPNAAPRKSQHGAGG